MYVCMCNKKSKIFERTLNIFPVVGTAGVLLNFFAYFFLRFSSLIGIKKLKKRDAKSGVQFKHR